MNDRKWRECKMVETVVSVGLPVDEKMDIKKNRIKPDTLTGKEKRICFVTGNI